MTTLLKRLIASSGSPDEFYTPVRALEPIIPLLKNFEHVLEPACGTGNISSYLTSLGIHVIAFDKEVDFLKFDCSTLPDNTCVVTNPPFSIKDKFIAKLYDNAIPFALLLPVNALGGKLRNSYYEKYGVSVILLGERIQFMNSTKSGPWFETAWFTWRMGQKPQIIFNALHRSDSEHS